MRDSPTSSTTRRTTSSASRMAGSHTHGLTPILRCWRSGANRRREPASEQVSVGGRTLANDYIHPTPQGGRRRIRGYLPEEEPDGPAVICSELPGNKGSSVAHSAHQIAAEVIRYHGLDAPPA